MKNKDKGFTTVEGAIVLFIIMALFSAAYIVYANSSKSNTPSSPISNRNTIETLSLKNTDAKKYLEIKEHNIKLELTEDIADAYYKESGDGYIYFSSHYFDNLEGFENCKAEPDTERGGLGILALVVAEIGKEDEYWGVWTKESLEEIGAAKVNNKYYFLIKGNGGPCWDTTKYADESPEVMKYYDIYGSFIEQQQKITALN